MSFWVKSKKKNHETRFANSRSRAPSLRPPPSREAPAPNKSGDSSSEQETISKPFPKQKSSKTNIEELNKSMEILDKEEEEWYAKHVQSRTRVGTVDGAPPAPDYSAPAPKRSFFRRFSAAPPPPKQVAIQKEEEPSSPPPVSLTPNQVITKDNQQYTVAYVQPNTTSVPLSSGDTGGGTIDEAETPDPAAAEKENKRKSLFREGTDSHWEDEELDDLHTEMREEMERLKSMTASQSHMDAVNNAEINKLSSEDYEDGLPDIQESYGMETPEVSNQNKIEENEEPVVSCKKRAPENYDENKASKGSQILLFSQTFSVKL